jgi:16S rRNA G966 N2-methylase RsmD
MKRQIMLQTIVNPINAVTGKPYSGGNVAKLIDAMDSDPRFVTGAFSTFRQWLAIGRCVRKGEACAARLLAFSDGQTQETESGEVKGKGKAKFKKGFCVFAIEQTDAIEGWTPDQSPTITREEDTEEAQPVAVAQIAKPSPTIDLAKISAKADKLIIKAEACFADRLQNTAKRLAQAMHKRMEGQRMERQAHILKAFVLASKDGQNPLPGATISDLFQWSEEAAIYKATPVSNGYHGYHVETTDAQYTEAHHVALRGLLDPRAVAASAEKIAKERAEADLRTCDFPGFFPTPASVVQIMLEQAGDLRSKAVLEPSAGKGDLVRAALEAGAKSVKAFEIVPKLADYLATFVRPTGAQCVVSQQADFLNELPVGPHARVDVVLMNPPFERDAAPAHVLHALLWLKPGGKLVSVMPLNWSEKKAADYLLRTIENMGLSMLEVEVDGPAFNGADSFRQTAVRTCILVIG